MKTVKQMTLAAGTIILFIILWAATGCEKEEPIKEECKCGIVFSSIANQPVEGSQVTYNTIVENYCTKNQKKFFTDHMHVGEKYCWNQQW